MYIVCHPSPYLLVAESGGGGGLNLQPNFQKEGGGLTGPQRLGGVAGKEDFKLKSEIFNGKKCL